MTFFTRALLVGTLVTTLHATAQTPTTFRAYSGCTFDDGLIVGEISVLPAGIRGRTVETLTGPRQVDILGGEHISFSYPGTDFFATVKIEHLPPSSFLQGKKDLISNFDHIIARGDDSKRNMTYVLRPRLNGFEIYGLDRVRLEGAILGIYLLFDNRTQIVTTVYFVNADPDKRKFSTLDQYAQLRDHFLDAYTGCIHAPHAAKPATRKPVAKRNRR
jgi:hypothetical protein